MPKIIENLRAELIAEAKRQILECGYAGTTIRSVAGGCGVGVGTVYNYFESKDMLIATFMLEDWMQSLEKLRTLEYKEPQELLLAIYTALREYSERYSAIFSDPEAHKSFAATFTHRHGQLRSQLAEIVSPLCGEGDEALLPDFIAEAMLRWTMAGAAFDELSAILMRLIKR